MQKLNLPICQFRLKEQGNKKQIFDAVRKKFVALTPEEWVRQHFVHFLISQQKISAGHIAIELPVNVNGLSQRADIVVHDRQGRAAMIIECKAPSVAINKAVFDQAARYNMPLRVQYMLVTNGLQHFCAELTGDKGQYQLLSKIPDVDDINASS
ncbi:type I restriction enzyme HsdR N-terminal domain-containing protein [Carboxylicivirga sp. N1Y90]|uniref:type I restriction enzyme HsdR N-terminal domain-containing protein n=1 Tax=Carboxylicivirga fragile TaxID=3417571 RepID=UPI003D326E5E|nr:type I restriction enzyme HsdR N-terminal domain-containing protein [Marinilabiliaceae bacterium N1Y90]